MDEKTSNKPPAYKTANQPGKRPVVSPLVSLPDKEKDTSKDVSISGIMTRPIRSMKNTGDDLPPLNTQQKPPDEQQKLVRILTQAEWEQRFPEISTKYPQEMLELINTQTMELHLEIINAKTQLLQSPTKEDAPAAAPQKKRKKIRRKMRRAPEMRQVTAVECGAACLAMILNYYGYATSVSEVQEYCGVGRDGLTALEIVRSARQYGLRVRAVSLDLDDFRFVTLPAIVHWEFNHFLIVERWSSTRIDVVDPAAGRRSLTFEEFDEGFTGVAIMLDPGAQFKQRSPQKSL